MKSHHPLRVFWLSGLLTILLGVVVAYYGSLADIWVYIVLVLLEVTFSFDNAVVNSRVLARMSPRWQTIFLTVGIVIAVFIIRFMLPILIVMLAGHTGPIEVVNMSLHHPDKYNHLLHTALPVINAFGGSFLLLIGLSYFMDRTKDIHWLKFIESKLTAAGSIRSAKTIFAVGLVIALSLTVDPSHQNSVLIAGLLGIILHSLLEAASTLFSHRRSITSSRAGKQVGWAAFSSFVYLEILDASFSFDGVIGAFAITSSVLLIIAGLGAGAVWVRSMTVYLLRSGTLGKYKYLEHGAHWAILILGIVMFLKLYGIESPEWLTGSLGLIFVGTAIASSVAEKRLAKR